jgi:phosphoserine phosphatase
VPVCGAYPVVVFDLDGTLLRGTTVSLMLARWLGHEEEMSQLEEAFHAGEISNRVVADATASWLAGQSTADAWRVLAKGSWIAGMAETFQTLAEARVNLLLGTITWSFIAERLSDSYGFAAFGGTEMHVTDGVVSGWVTRYFDEQDKLRFVRRWCYRNGFSMGEVAAIGDSRSDVPLFRHTGTSIALNATPDARAIASHVLDTDDLRNVLAFLHPADETRSRLEPNRS